MKSDTTFIWEFDISTTAFTSVILNFVLPSKNGTDLNISSLILVGADIKKYMRNWVFTENQVYCKCPKNLYTKVSDKMAYANSADPDQGLHCLTFH